MSTASHKELPKYYNKQSYKFLRDLSQTPKPKVDNLPDSKKKLLINVLSDVVNQKYPYILPPKHKNKLAGCLKPYEFELDFLTHPDLSLKQRCSCLSPKTIQFGGACAKKKKPLARLRRAGFVSALIGSLLPFVISSLAKALARK